MPAGSEAPPPPDARLGAHALSPCCDPVAVLPPDAIRAILLALPAADVARAARVSAAWRAAAGERALWARLLCADFDVLQPDAVGAADAGAGLAHPREVYAKRLAARATRAQAAARARTRTRAVRALARKRAVRARCVAGCVVPALLCVPFWLLLCAAVLLGAQLQAGDDGSGGGGTAAAAPSWWAVVAPVYLLLAAVTGACCLSAWAACSSPDSALVSAAGGEAAAGARLGGALRWLLPVRLAARARTRPTSPLARAVLCAWCTVLAAAVWAAPALVAWRLQGGEGAPASWGIALAPLWLAFALLPCACCAVAAVGARLPPGAWCSAWALAGCPALLALILLAARADGSQMPLVQALTPVWLVLGLCALATCSAACLACIKFAWDRDTTELAFLSAVAALLALIFGPPAASLILAAARASGAPAPPWHAVLAPLYAWLVLLAALATCTWCGVAQFSVAAPYLRWRQAASDPFYDEFGPPPGAPALEQDDGALAEILEAAAV